MARANKKKLFHVLTPQRRNELWGVLALAGSLFLLMSLISYHPQDLGFFTSDPNPEVRNLCGAVGAWVAGLFRSAIGWTSFLLPVLCFIWALASFSGRPVEKKGLKLVSAALLCVSASALLSLIWVQASQARVERGGLLGLMVAGQLLQYCGYWGALVVLSTVALLCLLLSTEMAFWPLLQGAGKLAVKTGQWAGERAGEVIKDAAAVTVHRNNGKKAAGSIVREPLKRAQVDDDEDDEEAATPVKIKEPPKINLPPAAPPVKAPVRADPSTATSGPKVKTPFQLPSLDLLNSPVASSHGKHTKELAEANAKVLEETLKDFGIEARVAEVELGPVITRYELEPAAGVKVQKITTLSDDLALALKASSVRIIAPIPGKARVGIEVPNSSSSAVTLREVLESREFQQSRSKLTIAIGKDSAGHPLLGNLGGMPHLLIAGATGSGKTVCMNALILSLLYRATPEEVRFLMVDPKMVELAAYNGLPHLVMPVLTNPKKVPAALEWAIEEMENRYRLFAKLGVRNIEMYHEKLAQNQLPADEIPDSLPYMVIIIDELADLMLLAQAEAEKAIARLAHLSRAVGIHMILATQRPSVDVLTGVIKANFPSRISFQVASRVDSRTVLDSIGAEKLLGKGDLLFMPPGASKLTRGQGTLVSDDEIERVVSFLKTQRSPSYEVAVLEDVEKRASGQGEQVKDALYEEALRVVVETGQASVSLLQRRMRLGYGRAARILDMMEQEGIVGPIRGAKPREVYQKEIPSGSSK